jgi:hypothetical protein
MLHIQAKMFVCNIKVNLGNMKMLILVQLLTRLINQEMLVCAK